MKHFFDTQYNLKQEIDSKTLEILWNIYRDLRNQIAEYEAGSIQNKNNTTALVALHEKQIGLGQTITINSRLENEQNEIQIMELCWELHQMMIQ